MRTDLQALAAANVPILALLFMASATVGVGEALAWLGVLVAMDGIIIRGWRQTQPLGR
jgi:uncharacterized membrane protein